MLDALTLFVSYLSLHRSYYLSRNESLMPQTLPGDPIWRCWECRPMGEWLFHLRHLTMMFLHGFTA